METTTTLAGGEDCAVLAVLGGAAAGEAAAVDPDHDGEGAGFGVGGGPDVEGEAVFAGAGVVEDHVGNRRTGCSGSRSLWRGGCLSRAGGLWRLPAEGRRAARRRGCLKARTCAVVGELALDIALVGVGSEWILSLSGSG